MKPIHALFLLAFAPAVFADIIQVPCDFKEDRGQRSNFRLDGRRGRDGSIQASGSIQGVSVDFAYTVAAGRTLNVSYYHNGGNFNLSNSRSGTGTIEYKRGLMSRAFGAPRDINVRCHPQNLVVISVEAVAPVVQQPPVARPTPPARVEPPRVDRGQIELPEVAANLPAGMRDVLTITPALARRLETSSSLVISFQGGQIPRNINYALPLCSMVFASPEQFTSGEGPFAVTKVDSSITSTTFTLERIIGGQQQEMSLTCMGRGITLQVMQTILGGHIDIIAPAEAVSAPEQADGVDRDADEGVDAQVEEQSSSAVQG